MFSWFFRELLYRPVLNALVFIYNLMPVYQDMGVAIIVLVVFMHFLLWPIRRLNKKAEPEQEKIMEELKKAKELYGSQPILYQKAKKEIIKKYRRTINLRGVDFLIEGIYFVVFWWVFAVGLPQKNWHLLYSFVKPPKEPVNLTFFHLFDLTVVSPMLNLISAIGLFVVLFLKNWWKEKKASRYDYMIMFWGPFAAYFISSQLPAGQEFFFTITETLTFIELVRNKIKKLLDKWQIDTSPISAKSFLQTMSEQLFGRKL